jgi:hypothetical protein
MCFMFGDDVDLLDSYTRMTTWLVTEGLVRAGEHCHLQPD